MGHLILEILVELFMDALAWVALFVLWVIVFPVVCLIMAPVFLLLAAFSRRPFWDAITDYYSKLLEWWLDIGSRMR